MSESTRANTGASTVIKLAEKPKPAQEVAPADSVAAITFVRTRFVDDVDQIHPAVDPPQPDVELAQPDADLTEATEAIPTRNQLVGPADASTADAMRREMDEMLGMLRGALTRIEHSRRMADWSLKMVYAILLLYLMMTASMIF